MGVARENSVYSLEMSAVWSKLVGLELREDEVRAGDAHFVIMHL